MSTANERGRVVVALLAAVCVAGLLGGCEAENLVIVNVPAAQARVVVTFPDLPELQRTIAVRGWVAQGPLEVASNVRILLSARTIMDGQPYVGNGFVPELAPGTSTTVPMQMFPER